MSNGRRGFFSPETRVVPSVSFEFGSPPKWENYTWSCNGIGCLHALLVLLYGWLPDIMPVQLCLIITAITFARKQMDFSVENRFWGWIILKGAAFRELRSSTCLSSEKIFCEMNKWNPLTPPSPQKTTMHVWIQKGFQQCSVLVGKNGEKVNNSPLLQHRSTLLT